MSSLPRPRSLGTLLKRRQAPPTRAAGLISPAEWDRPEVRWTVGSMHTLLLAFLVLIGLGPLLWLAKSAITPATDTFFRPLSLFPHGAVWRNLSLAWNQVHIGLYFWNTVVVAVGSWASQILVATTGAFVLSVLRPRYAGVVTALLYGTIFVPVTALIIPLYVFVVHPPLVHHSFLNSYWAIWLPAGASAFNVILMKRFFDNLPRELFEAARIDGAGPFRLFRSVVLPLSKPILGVVSIFAVLASWKDFLWPLLILQDPNKQTLSVRLTLIFSQTDEGVLLAAMMIACILPIVGFLIFQRTILRGSGLGGALKG